MNTTQTEAEQPKKEAVRPRHHRRKPLPCLQDWDFWRFFVTALGLLWDILKTTFLR